MIDKVIFWQKLTLTHRQEMRILKVSGLIGTRDGESFRNVAQHSLIQLAIHDVLGRLDGSNPDELADQKRTTLLHDADKKITTNPQDFTEDDLVRYKDLRDKIKPNEAFIRSESGVPNHVDILVNGKVLDYQTQKAWYVDNIAGKAFNPQTRETEEDIVPLDKRIDELKIRRSKIAEDIPLETIAVMEKVLKEKYNWDKPYNYWEVERVLSKIVEQNIFDRLKANNVGINLPSDIPMFVKSQIEKQYSAPTIPS